MTRPGIEPRPPGPLVNTLTACTLKQNLMHCMSCVLWLVANNGSWQITQALIRRCLRGSKCKVSYVISFNIAGFNLSIKTDCSSLTEHFPSFFITLNGLEYGASKGFCILSVHSYTCGTVFSSLGTKDLSCMYLSFWLEGYIKLLHLLGNLFMSSLIWLGYFWSRIGFGSSNWIPVTVVAEEKPCSLGIFLIPRNMTGNALKQLNFLIMITVFRVWYSLSIIPLVWEWYAVVWSPLKPIIVDRSLNSSLSNWLLWSVTIRNGTSKWATCVFKNANAMVVREGVL